MQLASRLTESMKRQSFGILLEKALNLSNDERVLIIHDESLAPYCAALVDELVMRDQSVVLINIPKPYQHFLVGKILSQPEVSWLPAALITAISQSSVILNLLDGDLSTARLRKAVIEQPRTRDCRLAHIPGLSDEILSITLNTDFADVLEQSELLAWMLGNGRDAELTSYDSSGKEYLLRLDLGGWENEPLMSPGTLFPGSWGNFPPGETFCCPAPAGVCGSVCISGSVPGIVLRPGEEIVLDFDAGSLVRWRAVTQSPATKFFDDQQAIARKRGDEHWNQFAEFGVGLNSAIAELTGNSLFDEKVAGTVHVAIGDNTTFGHTVKASIHADLVMWRPTLSIAGTTVMSRGELRVEELRNYRRDWRPPRIELPVDTRIRVREADVKQETGVLRRRLCKAGRVGMVEMGEPAIGKALDELYAVLAADAHMQIGSLLQAHPSFHGHATDELIMLLSHYHCLR